MNVKVGDRIAVESEAVGEPAREGEILEVVEGGADAMYRVRWSDGHESTFAPTAGSVRVVASGG
jgi:hypothetical protein